jgi:hypothetical protein
VATRHRLSFLTAASILGVLSGLSVLAQVQPTRAQGDAQEVGVAENRGHAVELIGKIDQSALAFSGYGYFTSITGIPADQMFSDPVNHNEATAHFTFASTATASARSVIETIFVLNGTGSSTIYYNESPAGDFADPTTFAEGSPIATTEERWQNIISVQAPDTAISTTLNQLTVADVTPFAVGDTTYQFGHAGLVLQLTYLGEAKRSDAILPASTTVFAGYGVVGD